MKIILLYVIFSVSGLLMLKIGAVKGLELQVVSGKILFTINAFLLIGICFYIISFIMSLIAMKSTDLSVFYPISAGLIYVLICFFSYVLLNEKITISQIIGIVFILSGVLLINLNK
ncbi:hypothetical protein C823_000525 [Eubacterium plexicaudatum ASF492]|uniref:EamA domain-containing protein n=1 Tax=Eubacterium plexicaudatum ASF492 TaxID=1235802 RepID=N1ZYK3_9FIRM|nr:hypothetical protein C823_000525 [Eubacterium plexicaudatum ASF492]